MNSYNAAQKDEEGYLLDPSVWNINMAEEIAQSEKIEMSPMHWEVVNFVRDYFEKNQSVPELRITLKHMQHKFAKEQATRKYIYSLFPYGYGQQTCKIAGMRKPRKLMLDV